MMVVAPFFLVGDVVDFITGAERRARREREQAEWDRNLLVVRRKIDRLRRVVHAALRVTSR